MSDAQITELETLRRQLQQLHELFGALIDETRPTADNPAVMAWPELLSKFNVLASKYAVLSQTVGHKSAALLRELAVVPQARPNGIQEQSILGVLLRTKLAPEIEHEEDQIRAQIEAAPQQDGRHESLAIAAMDAFRSLRKTHDSRVRGLLDAGTQPQPASVEGQPAGAQPGAEVSLEEVLSFMSSGTRV
ncbi:hypothetical protein H4R18_003230 [Coemansia javaensis]|uniref:Mediator of RNA polymerase II transcription subunit 8 n=1 Tax=Coemansia javaensis TaxID=2761396 RepID=A0A9W8LGL9_9FUNG|nr:hypothetical protein H4R18_003230 [Coemansia javaensis]